MVREAEAQSKGHHWAIEILIFIAVFFISSLVLVGIIATVGTILLIFLDPSFLHQIMAFSTNGAFDTESITKFATEIVEKNPGLMIVSLISFVGLTVGVFIYCRFIEKRKLYTLGFRIKKAHALREYLVGLLIGAVIITLPILLALVTGSVVVVDFVPQALLGIIPLFFVGYVIQGMAEEVACRGYLMVSLARRYNLAIAAILSSATFAMLHIFNPGITALDMLAVFLFGVLAALLIIKRGNIWGAAAMHTSWNFVQGNIFGLQVSGNAKTDSLLVCAPVEGADMLSGGDFGIEGSVAVLFVIVIAIFILWRMKPNSQFQAYVGENLAIGSFNASLSNGTLSDGVGALGSGSSTASLANESLGTGSSAPDSPPIRPLYFTEYATQKMQDTGITRENVEEALSVARRDATILYNPESGLYVISAHIGNITLWVHYSEELSGTIVKNAYYHRMEV
jgi:membrane protease YdiL (CAAX protease family)